MPDCGGRCRPRTPRKTPTRRSSTCRSGPRSAPSRRPRRPPPATTCLLPLPPILVSPAIRRRRPTRIAGQRLAAAVDRAAPGRPRPAGRAGTATAWFPRTPSAGTARPVRPAAGSSGSRPRRSRRRGTRCRPLPATRPTATRKSIAFALELRDKIPPQPPLGVQAWALDPLDRWLFARRGGRPMAGPGRAGPGRLAGQLALDPYPAAPGAGHPRVPRLLRARPLERPGRPHPRGDGGVGQRSWVTLDLVGLGASDDYAGTRLRVGNDDFRGARQRHQRAAEAAGKNIGVGDRTAPRADADATVAIPEMHRLWVDTGRAHEWSRRLALVPYETGGADQWSTRCRTLPSSRCRASILPSPA